MKKIRVFIVLKRIGAIWILLAAFSASAAALSVAAPIPPGPEKTLSLSLRADFAVTYGYDRNGNRISEVGPSSHQTGEANTCANGRRMRPCS